MRPLESSLALASTVALDPATGAYAALADMTTVRAYPGFVALLDGRLMAVEGQTSSGSPGITSVETYTLGTNTWR